MNIALKTKFSVALIVCLIATSVTASAQIVPTTDRGWYRSDGLSDPAISNYITGEQAIGTDPVLEFRSWFLFDVPTLSASESFTSATLQLENPDAGIEILNSTLDLTVFDVLADLNDLADGTNGVATFADLGIGAIFGQVTINEVDFRNGGIVNIQLNNTAINELNLASGSQLAFGLTLTAGDADNHIFGLTDDTHTTQLEFVTVPEPVAGTLLALGMVAGIARRRRK